MLLTFGQLEPLLLTHIYCISIFLGAQGGFIVGKSTFIMHASYCGWDKYVLYTTADKYVNSKSFVCLIKCTTPPPAKDHLIIFHCPQDER